MQAVALLVVLLAASACEPAVEVARPAKLAAKPQASERPAPVPRALATGCAAEPGTVYGQEDVVFRVEGQGAAGATVQVELRDEQARTLSQAAVTLPALLRPPGLGSGDFLLIVGDNQVSCVVTVNRELSRASQKQKL